MNDRTRVDSPYDLPLFSQKGLDTTQQDITQGSIIRSYRGSVSARKSGSQQEEKTPDLLQILELSVRNGIEDLENALFFHTKEYVSNFSPWEFSLDPFLTAHPLVSLHGNPALKLQAVIESQIKVFIHSDPYLILKYRWTLKMLDFVGKLSANWGLISLRQFRHRFSPLSSLVPIMQLAQCSRLHELILVPDVFYIAAGHQDPNTNLNSAEEKQTAQELTKSFVQTVDFLLTLNKKVDFRVHGSITDCLYSGITGRVTPMTIVPSDRHQRVPSLDKFVHARRIGFHVFDRGSLLSLLCCERNPVHSQNRKLTKILKTFWKTYQAFEISLSQRAS